jgi:signal transduction histidine kinase
MADASHELRTPVAIISAESELALARNDRPAAELRGALQIVFAEGRRLRGIVDDLFLLTRADAGERLLRPEALYLHDLLEESALTVRTLAVARSLDFRVEIGPDDMPTVGDDSLLRRLFVNLLDNAIKYSKPGGIVRLCAGRSGSAYHMDVSDTGIGVPPSDRDRIFDRFFRGDGARASSNASGAGIGLAISRWVARSHGGDIVLLESSPSGSTFRVMLPVRTIEDFNSG